MRLRLYNRWTKRLKDLLLTPTRERVGVKSNYNLYRMHPILRWRSPGVFRSDTDEDFPAWLEQLRQKSYRKALILGNAPCLNELTEEGFQELKKQGYLTIGLNRSIYEFQTDMLLWSDLKTIDDILKRQAVRTDLTTVLHVLHERDHRLKAKDDQRFQALHKYWSTHRNFRNWNKPKLYMFRNIAIGALQLCYRLDIRDVTMVGFGFDDRGYFYKTEAYKEAGSYEIISEENLKENCGGYDTQRIVREVLEYLTGEEGFSIRYNGDSHFLGTVSGLKKVSLVDLLAGAESPDG